MVCFRTLGLILSLHPRSGMCRNITSQSVRPHVQTVPQATSLAGAASSLHVEQGDCECHPSNIKPLGVGAKCLDECFATALFAYFKTGQTQNEDQHFKCSHREGGDCGIQIYSKWIILTENVEAKDIASFADGPDGLSDTGRRTREKIVAKAARQRDPAELKAIWSAEEEDYKKRFNEEYPDRGEGWTPREGNEDGHGKEEDVHEKTKDESRKAQVSDPLADLRDQLGTYPDKFPFSKGYDLSHKIEISNPLGDVQKPLGKVEVPSPLGNVPNPLASVPNPLENVPNPLATVPNPLANVPKPLGNQHEEIDSRKEKTE